MAIFELNGYSNEQSSALIADAYALTSWSYHNLDDGLAWGYQHYGFQAGLPLTLLKALIGNSASQGVIPGLPWNPDSEAAALAKINQAGWHTISADELGYQGKVNAQGTFYGEKKGYTTAQAEIMGKYDDNGQLIQIGIAFRGTSGPRGELLTDTLGDVINDLQAVFYPADYSNNYAQEAFGTLLDQVADYAQENGLSGSDILVTGHSLGGLATNSLASLSEGSRYEFYADSAYIALASPTQTENGKVLNIGFENDPVFRSLDGTDFNLATPGVHDKPHESSTDNIVNFNDYYASTFWGLLPYSVLNLPSWLTHMPFFYDESLSRILDSDFYSLMEKDSTVIVANLSSVARGKTWVQDLNKSAEKHSGPTFILGSDANDLIAGGKGNDYLEGGAGNDTFRDTGGYNIIHGGEGHNTLELQHALSDSEIAWDGSMLYLRDAAGGITQATDIDTIRSQESFLLFWHQNKDHQVTSEGLRSGNYWSQYARSVTGDEADNTLTAKLADSWLFGREGDDILTGTVRGHTTFVGGEGDDALYSKGGNNTFLFSGSFGHDKLYDVSDTDSLVFMGIAGASGGNYLDYVTFEDDNAVFDFGDSSVTLVGVNPHIFTDGHIVLA